ncbi:MAG: sulfatase [Planctomycetaceae bacterium]
MRESCSKAFAWAVVMAACWACPAAAANRRPNILFIFSDDHAEQALSCYGSRVNTTPHLDRLAAGGARFTNSFVTNSICSPSRATLLTGQYSHLNGVPVFNPFDGSRDHVAKRLQAAGYHTGLVGKWHLGSDPTGFDRWIVLPGQGAYWNPEFLVPGGRLTIEGHCTEITGDLGVEFLKTRPADAPFFLMLHHKAPHRPWQPDERNQALFAHAEFPDPPTLFDDYATRPAALPENAQTIARHLTNNDLKRTPPAGLSHEALRRWRSEAPMELTVNGRMLTGAELVRWKYRQFMRDYLACVQGVDDSVGEVLDYLDEAGLAADTVVIYSTDNGWYMGERGLYDKRFMYEPGLRVPLLALGPGITPGITPGQMVANIDLAPTFLDLAGLPVPESMQGRSLVPLLRGESPADWRTSVYYRYYHDPGDHDTRAHVGVRTATHKLIHYWTKDAWELFDLVADPLEQRNLLHGDAATRDPAVAKLFADMQAELARLRALYRDDDRYADPASRPTASVHGDVSGRPRLGVQTASAAMKLTNDTE